MSINTTQHNTTTTTVAFEAAPVEDNGSILGLDGRWPATEEEEEGRRGGRRGGGKG
jgi:hypothetical protein